MQVVNKMQKNPARFLEAMLAAQVFILKKPG
jgi:hypothetical protein